MSRAPRSEHTGALYHVTSRATGSERLFRDDHDRLRFLGLLAQVVATQRWRCLAYCLMDTHVHLIVVTPEANLGTGMRWLKTRYAATYNSRHDRQGALFGGRFFAVVLDDEPHALSAVVYVALNAVRAGIVERPRQWPWSSHPATAGLAAPPTWLDVRRVYEIVGAVGADPARRYAEIVERALSEPKPVTVTCGDRKWSHNELSSFRRMIIEQASWRSAR